MTTPTKLTAITAALVLGFASAALASGHGGTHGRSSSAPGHTRTQQTSSIGTTGTTTAPNATAFGRLCQSESKKHVAGQSGTPFSDCVTDMAKLANRSATNPARTCANESKKHVAGQPGTPFSQCVKAAAKLRGRHNGSSTTTTTSTTSTTSAGS